MGKVGNILLRQLSVNALKNLLYKNPSDLMEQDEEFIRFLEKSTRGFSKLPDEKELSEVVNGMLQTLYEVNQYVHVDEQSRTELASIYISTWRAVQTGMDIRTTLNEVHYPRLKDWLAGLYPPEFLEPLGESRKIGHVVCEEYSPQLQLEIFRLDLAGIHEPVLDVGCGKEARLVRHLRNLGIDTYGFDRMAAGNDEFVCRSDWFEYPYHEKRWGTILSNMAFSNHLNYAFQNHMPDFERYLGLFLQILTAIQPGGCILYAPSLPFIERRLDKHLYSIEGWEIGNRVSVCKISKNRS